MSSRFGWLDAAIIISYLLILAGIGVYFSRKQKNLEDFFLAGRSMGWVPVGMSLMAALNSGIDYLMEPFKVFTYGLIFISARRRGSSSTLGSHMYRCLFTGG